MLPSRGATTDCIVAVAVHSCSSKVVKGCLLSLQHHLRFIPVVIVSRYYSASAGSPELLSAHSESSHGVHSTSLVQPNSEATATRQQLLMALSLLKHLAHNSPAACEAIVAAGVMDTVRRYPATGLPMC